MTVVKRGQPLHVQKTNEDSITIVMDLTMVADRPPVRLVLRCERDGRICASIDRGVSRGAD
jgi:hypothetical protein